MTSALPDIPGGWTDRTVLIAGRELVLTIPADPDAFLEDPEVHARHNRTDYMPYWPYLWPSAITMAEVVASKPELLRGRSTLEIGAGVGLVGLAALSAGADVTFSDYDAVAVQAALSNASRNGFEDHAAGLTLDWSRPLDRDFDVVIGCEVLYETGNHPLVLGVLDRMLSDGGLCLIGDPGRRAADAFTQAAQAVGYSVTIRTQYGEAGDLVGTGEFRMFELQR